VLGSRDLGHRVVVRHIVGIRDNRPVFSDVLGELVELTESEVTVATRGGPVRVAVARIHRARRVPPRRRPGGPELRELELAAAAGWPAPETARLGDWLLRAGAGWTARANSALPLGDPGVPLAAAVDEVIRWYRHRDLRPMVSVPLPYAAPVDAELVRRGWPYRARTLVQTAALADLHSRADPARAAAPTGDASAGNGVDPVVRLTPTPSREWLALVAGRKGQLPPVARHLLTAVDPVRFAEVRAIDGALLAVGRGAVTGAAADGRGWLGLSLVEVIPAARRRGLARRVVAELARWAAGRGADRAYLQVEEQNAAAVACYARLGFRTHHEYLTRYAPG